MKGMSCGTRALGLVALTALASAVAPALARADVTGGQLPTVTPPAVPAVPAAPALPSPAAPAAPAVSAPALPAPAANAAAANAVKVQSTAGGSVTVNPSAGSLTIHVPLTKASVSRSSGSVKVDASKIVKPINTKVNKQIAKVTGNKHVKKATAKTAKVVKTGSRVLAWDSGSDPGDPMKGCKDGKYTTCTVIPLSQAPFIIDNRCWDYTGPNSSNFSMPDDGGDSTGTPPPFGPDPVTFSQGTEVIWTHAEPGSENMVPGTRIHFKQFVWGLQGVGSTDGGAIYKLGHDFQDEWEVFVPLGLGMSIKKLTQDLLLVDNHSVQPAPNMVYTEHMSMSADGSISVQWHIVCHTGQTGDGKKDQDHDRSGDMDKYKHHKDDFHGYNDDDQTSWDQND